MTNFISIPTFEFEQMFHKVDQDDLDFIIYYREDDLIVDLKFASGSDLDYFVLKYM